MYISFLIDEHKPVKCYRLFEYTIIPSEGEIMLKEWSLLDCTFRDGASTISFGFEIQFVQNILKLLNYSGVDYVELGYKSGSGSSKCDLSNPLANVNTNYLETIRNMNLQIKTSVMIVANVAALDDLYILKEYDVDLTRIAVYPENFQEGIRFIRKAKSLNLNCSLNLMASSYTSADELVEYSKQVASEGVDVFYFADSFGHFIPSDVEERIIKLKEATDIAIGFHAHNNLSYAMENTMIALRNGATFVDASLCGMGRGAGNAQTEIIPFVSGRIPDFNKKFDNVNIIKAAEYIKQYAKNPLLTSEHIISGAANIHSYFWGYLDKVTQSNIVETYDIAYKVGKHKVTRVSEELIKSLI